MNHTVKTALERKLSSGETITQDDMDQACQYAKRFGTLQGRALYAKMKRVVEQQAAAKQ